MNIKDLSQETIKTHLQNDSFYNKLSEENKDQLFNKILKFQTSPGHIGPNQSIWHGEIKICNKCLEVRVTDCCACGCGSCLTCGYRYCCRGNNQGVNLFSFIDLIPKSRPMTNEERKVSDEFLLSLFDK